MGFTTQIGRSAPIVAVTIMVVVIGGFAVPAFATPMLTAMIMVALVSIAKGRTLTIVGAVVRGSITPASASSGPMRHRSGEHGP